MIDTANFKITGGGAVTATDITLTGGTIKTSNYTAASGDTKTVGGKLNLSATGATLLLDTANFKITGGGAVTAEDATFTNCTINGGTFTVVTSGEDYFSRSLIDLKHITSDHSYQQIVMKPGSLNAYFNNDDTDYVSIDGRSIRLGYIDSEGSVSSSLKTELNNREISTDSITVREISLERDDTLIPQINVENLGPILYVYPTTYLLYFGNPDFELKLYGSKTTVNDKNIATSPEVVARLEATVGHSSKNLLDITKYTANTNVSNIQINETTGSLSFTGTGTFKDVRYNNDVLGLEPNNNATYVVSCINNLVTETDGRLTVRSRENNLIKYSVNFKTTGKKELIFTVDPETFPDGWFISIIATGSASTTGNVDISNLMLREASVSDDTFEPYVTPTDERIALLEARIAALEART
jgi:hypothetical protein